MRAGPTRCALRGSRSHPVALDDAVIEIACTCDDLPAHSHVYQPKQDGKRLTMVPEPFDVRVWVDWRAVARALTCDAVTDR